MKFLNTKGATVAEYGITLAAISVAGITAIHSFGGTLENVFSSTGGEIADARDGSPEAPFDGFLRLPDGTEIPMPGTCFDDTAGRDSYGTGRGLVPAPGPCLNFINGGWDMVNEVSGANDFRITVNYTANNTGPFSIHTGAGTHYINYIKGSEIHLSNYAGGFASVMVQEPFANFTLSSFERTNVNFTSATKVLDVEGIMEQDPQYRFDEIHFLDRSFTPNSMAEYVVGLQQSSGNDTVQGTGMNDVIAPGAGDDFWLTGWAGDDRYVYDSGNDVILFDSSFGESGTDTLDLTKYTQAAVTFCTNGNDARVVTPDGSVTIDEYMTMSDGDLLQSVDRTEFSDNTLSDAQLRSLASSGGAC